MIWGMFHFKNTAVQVEMVSLTVQTVIPRWCWDVVFYIQTDNEALWFKPAVEPQTLT